MRRAWRWITEKIIIPNALVGILLAIIGIVVTLLIYPQLGESIGSLLGLIVAATVGSFAFVAAVRQAVERTAIPKFEDNAPGSLHHSEAPISAHLAQLHPTPADFVGRNSELAELTEAVSKEGSKIVGLFGMGGIGKTTLARRFIESVIQDFAHGQIELDMMGLSDAPISPELAMEEVLRAHNPSMTSPASSHEMEAMYFSTLKDRREVILLDNAANREQVEGLIPPSDCLLVVTSRQQFALPGMHRITLQSLPSNEAESLLASIAPRITGHEKELAATCAFHPMALRLAASALAVDESLDPQEYLSLLKEAQGRLALVEASLDLSYRLMNPELQSRWRSLAAFPGSFDRSAAQEVMALDVRSGQEALSIFLNSSLIEFNSVTERFRLHDLFRDFADNKLVGGGRTIALLRHAQHFQKATIAAAKEFALGGNAALGALDRIDIDWRNIAFARRSLHKHAEEDINVARRCAYFCGYFIDIITIRLPPKKVIKWAGQSLSCAEILDDWKSIRANKTFIANALIEDGQYPEAIVAHHEALEISRENDDKTGIAMSHDGLGNAHMLMGDLDTAVDNLRTALDLSKDLGDRRGQGHSYRNLGTALMKANDLQEAEEALRKGLEIGKEFDDPVGIAVSLNNLAWVLMSKGESEEARESFEEALAIKRQIGDLNGQITSLMNLAQMKWEAGEKDEGLAMLTEAIEIAISVDSPEIKRLQLIEKEFNAS